MSGYAQSCGTYGGGLVGLGKGSNCVCDLPTLVILILIVLQFSKCSNKDCNDGSNWFGDKQVGNGVLFIIALFFLSCSGCGRGNNGGY